MKRKFLIEESDETQNTITEKFDAFADGVEKGVQVCLRWFSAFLIFFVIAMIYMIKTW